MKEHQFSDQLTLAQTAENLGKQAMASGLITSFVIHYFPDNWVFYLSDQERSEPLTPEEAYLYFQKLLKS